MVNVKSVLTGSAADLAGIKRGDCIVRINGNDINDVLDYRYYITEERVRLLIHRGPELFDVLIRKPQYDDIGVEFETFLMDEKKCCRNKCIFCFIDQLPEGMRDALYFKDDDSRLSFLMGNYITMTNMSDQDMERIVKMRMTPINISVHTTNPELRTSMLNNRFAGKIMDNMRYLADNGIEMHCQIVLCRGVNDGAELERSMNDLASLYPNVSSVSVVPAGLTKYRDGLFHLEPFTPDECGKIIDSVERFAADFREKNGVSLIYAADELYISAGRKLPSGELYDGYPQIENGVGMITSMEEEFGHALEDLDDYDPHRPRRFSVATGKAAYGFISSLVDRLGKKCMNFECGVYCIENDFFGENITVSGLLTGKDIYHQLRGKDLGSTLFLSSNMLRYDRERFLDDTTPEWLEKKLNVRIVFVDSDGYDFAEKLLTET